VGDASDAAPNPVAFTAPAPTQYPMKPLEITPQELLARLREHKTLKGVPDHELEWLIAHGTPGHFKQGDPTLPPDLSVDLMYIMFTGHLSIYVDRGVGSRRTMDWWAGDIAGLLPYSRAKTAPGMPIMEEPSDVLALHRSQLGEMARECPEVTARCVQSMLDRARIFTQHDEQDEKLKSLGKLSAGLAHELDNPAAAVMRSSKVLSGLVSEADRAAIALGEAHVPRDQLDFIEKLRNECVSVRAQHVRSPLEQARHEEAIADWLEDHDIEVACAEALSETTITLEQLDQLHGRVDRPILEPTLRWIASGCAVRTIVAETGEAATRMSELVRAVRAFTHRDESATAQPVDVEQGLTETLAVHRAKAKEKSVRVKIQAEPDLPRVETVPGELNQVWSNLLDNALDAVEDGGAIDVIARRAGDSAVTVSIIDNGPGVPSELKERIFEPFFTTKPVGQGTGQGLDIVKRLVSRRRGRVDLFSVPGRTEFRVTLPISASQSAAASLAGQAGGDGSAAVLPSSTDGSPASGREVSA
jgi:signal transduction histidine kinase